MNEEAVMKRDHVVETEANPGFLVTVRVAPEAILRRNDRVAIPPAGIP